MMPAILELDQISKTYPDGWLGQRSRPALREVSLRIEPGEVVGLVGPNRAGKTTLIKLSLSLCRPTSGSGTRFGQPLHERGTLARVGYVHESHAFPGYLTARGALEFYGALSLLPEAEVRARVPRLLETAGLADRSREPIRRFSKGMLQRLAVAQAILNEPDLLVLDEPSEGLDLEGREMLREVVAQRRSRGGAVLFVSHALGEIETLCDRVAVLVGGRLARCGSVAELRGPGNATAAGAATFEQVLSNLYQTHPL
jgi:ABC-2 type transport system ATP-binding protein